MEVISIVLATVSITVIAYDFRQRKIESSAYNEAKEKLETAMKTLSETNNAAVNAHAELSEKIELLQLKVSGLQNAIPNRRV